MRFFKSFIFRYLRFFLIGLAAFIVVETGVLIFINNYYLKDNSEYTTKIITPSSSKAEIKKVDIQSGAQDDAGSHDGRYIAYQINGAVSILDVSDGQVYNIDSVANMQVSLFKWVYDRDRLIIAEKSTGSGNCYIKLYYYDMKDEALTEIRNNNNNEDLKININKSDTVTGLDMSTEMVKEYVKITDKLGMSRLWIVDAFVGANTRSTTVTKDIGKIQDLKSQEKLLYENAANGKVYLYGDTKPISVDGNTKLSLLGFDNNDNVYLADTELDTTQTVYFGSYNADDGSWNWSAVSLNKPVSPKDIYVTYGGSVFYVDKTDSSLVRAWQASGTDGASYDSSSSEASSSADSSADFAISTTGIKFEGTVISIFDNGFLTVYNNQVTPNYF